MSGYEPYGYEPLRKDLSAEQPTEQAGGGSRWRVEYSPSVPEGEPSWLLIDPSGQAFAGWNRKDYALQRRDYLNAQHDALIAMTAERDAYAESARVAIVARDNWQRESERHEGERARVNIRADHAEAASQADREALVAAREALREIARLDPALTSEGYNEWGQALCFADAQRIAAAALASLDALLGTRE